MDRKLPALLLLAAAAGGWILLWPVTAIQFENDDRGTAAWYRVKTGESFSVTYIHSIYRQPVTEEFLVGPGGDLVLTGVRSESGAVLEYFGFSDSRPYHPMNRPMRAIVFRVAVDGAQVLEIHGRRIPFSDLGGPGDRITLRLEKASLAVRWIGRAVKGS